MGTWGIASFGNEALPLGPPDTAVLRPATPADRAALIALALAEDAAWCDAPAVSAEETGELIDHHRPGVIFERNGRVMGYAAVEENGGTILLADPGEAEPALEVLTAWLVEHGGHEVDAYARDAPRIAWLEAHGFTHRRSSFDLQRGVKPPLVPPIWPDGVTIAAYRHGVDDHAVHQLIYIDAAWADVPGHTHRSLEAWRSLLKADYRGWVARRDGRPVGSVLGRLFSDGRGWIQQLAVARSIRGRGLGRALLLHQLDEFCSRGASSLALAVQAENQNALALYRDIGFAIEREWRLYAAPEVARTAG